ncbi:MAG: SGNH/GDSL hydrolase family protein [Prolixibacteraceae bacterium]|nr:SGNH/GDSL hydrolase family protein [Burkholderiales bacterium]
MDSWLSLRRSLSFGRVAWKPGRRTLALGCMLIALLVTCELAGRAFGLHTPVLYETTAYGYRVRPNQDILRFGNRYFSNEFGMRSESITRLPSPGVLRVLILGDSITNGGAITDQMDTYPQYLQRQLLSGERKAEVLNASAPGWAIANEAGWLRTNGTFGAQVVLLTIGTSDLFQDVAEAEIVDRHPSFPSQAPVLALEELWQRYVMPRLLRKSFADPGAGEMVGSPSMPGKAVAQVLSITELVRGNGAVPVVLYVERPGQLKRSDREAAEAMSLLFVALQQHRISYRSTREVVEQAGGASLFRDGLHPNAVGNRLVAQAALELLASANAAIPPAVE